MIYLAGRDVREIYLGDKPVASVYLGNRPIWQSRVYADTGAAVIVLPSDAALRTADGVTYTVGAVGGGVSCATAAAVPGADAGNAAVFAIPVVAQPYMRHIAPTQSVSPYAPLAETMLVILPSERGGVTSVGGPEQAANITPGQGNDADARHIGAPIQRSDMVAGAGGILKNAECGISPQQASITGGSGAVMRQTEVYGGVYDADVIGGAGETTDQSPAVGGLYRAKPLYGNADDIAASSPASSLRAEIAPGSAGIIPVSCEQHTPTAAAELLGGYAGIQQVETTDGTPPVCAVADHGIGAAVLGDAYHAAGAIYAARMITRIYTDPSTTVFDAALVTEMDILALVDLDQMAIQN